MKTTLADMDQWWTHKRLAFFNGTSYLDAKDAALSGGLYIDGNEMEGYSNAHDRMETALTALKCLGDPNIIMVILNQQGEVVEEPEWKL